MIETGLRGRTVRVTGGAGGIGAAISRAFAAEGARVACPTWHRSRRRPKATSGRTGRSRPKRPPTSPRNSATGRSRSRRTSPYRTAPPIWSPPSPTGSVDVLVNNAALCEEPDTVTEAGAASLERHYRVNAVAPALRTAEVARRRGGTPRAS